MVCQNSEAGSASPPGALLNKSIPDRLSEDIVIALITEFSLWLGEIIECTAAWDLFEKERIFGNEWKKEIFKGGGFIRVWDLVI